MSKIRALAKKKEKKEKKNRQQTVANKVGMKPNGADYDGITTQRNIKKKKKSKKQNKAAALGACGTAGLTLWLMQQLSSRGKIRGKVARLQAAIHSRADFCQSDL